MKIKTDFRESEGVNFTGITLGRNDIVRVGVYSTHGMKVSTVLNRYGKKGVLNLLLHYDLEEEILEEYHIHRLFPEEKEMREKVQQMNKVQEETNVSVPVEETFETTTTQDVEKYIKENGFNDQFYFPNGEDTEICKVVSDYVKDTLPGLIREGEPLDDLLDCPDYLWDHVVWVMTGPLGEDVQDLDKSFSLWSYTYGVLKECIKREYESIKREC